MTLENVNFGNLSLGFTFLVRLKRLSFKKEMFLTTCGGADIVGAHLKQMKDSNFHFGTTKQFYNEKMLQLNNLAFNRFVNLGVTALPVQYLYTLYYNNSFVTPDQDENTTPGSAAAAYNSYSVGSKCGSKFFFNGTVRAAGIANNRMTEDEINKFFDLIQ
jgi:hypothetical protein